VVFSIHGNEKITEIIKTRIKITTDKEMATIRIKTRETTESI